MATPDASNVRRWALSRQLTPREREVWALMAQGLSNQAIAERMVLGGKSVENYVNSLYGTLGINDVTYSKRVKAVLLYQQNVDPAVEARKAAEAIKEAAILSAQAATVAETERAEELQRRYLLALLAESLLFLRLAGTPAGLDGQHESLMGRILEALKIIPGGPRLPVKPLRK